MATVGVSMIVKNEARKLPWSLKNHKAVADEIVVVDTGSTDGTPEVARELGARVHFFKWIDSFSAAGNYALDQVQSDFVLMLDADEILAKDTIQFILEEKENPRADVYSFNRASIPWDYEKWKIALESPGAGRMGGVDLFNTARLFRNGIGIRLVGRIHAGLGYPAGSRFLRTENKLFHYVDVTQVDRKLLYYEELMKRSFTEEPESTVSHIKYLKILASRRDWVEFRKYLDLLPPLDTSQHFPVEEFALLAPSLRSFGQQELAEKVERVAQETRKALTPDPGLAVVPAEARHDLFPRAKSRKAKT